jgi:hypothetical protein
MSVELLELAADSLGELVDEVVFVGGATLALWTTDPAAPPSRPTTDVDVVVEVTTRSAFHNFEQRLRGVGFREDQEQGVICRWRHSGNSLVLDVMPADPAILGFENRWQREALPYAVPRELPSGARIRAIPPPYLLATKIEAFKSRGAQDYLGSPDFGDIVTIIDGREEVVDEVSNANADLRSFLGDEIPRLMADARFDDGVFSALRPDEASQARAEAVVLPRLRAIAGGD